MYIRLGTFDYRTNDKIMDPAYILASPAGGGQKKILKMVNTEVSDRIKYKRIRIRIR